MTAMPQAAFDALLKFFRWESAGGLLLIVAACFAMLAANSPLAATYFETLNWPLPLDLGFIRFEKTTLLWINDLLMAIFFLLVGLELKREIKTGQFSNPQQILLPVACAMGGMLVPMAIYALINYPDETAMRGVAIPAATDIAFALGVLSLLGSRVPLSLKMLLTAIAVADDLGAIIIIAIFYTEQLTTNALMMALGCLAVLVVGNRAGISTRWFYLPVGLLMWASLLKSGVHATLAGVALGFCIPLHNKTKTQSPLEALEHAIHPWVAFLILPLFAFANAGVSLSGLSVDVWLQPVPIGVALGLLVGKPLGIFSAALILIASKRAAMPDGMKYSSLFGMSLLCAIGFTMSLFIGSLAFEHSGESWMVAGRIGILTGSIVAAVAGYLYLRMVLEK
jgi:Na+:H+ antiporter, NhaA family